MQKFLYRRRGLLAGIATIACLGILILGLNRLFQYTLPLYNGDQVSAAQSDNGDPVVAFYDAALDHYKNQDYQGAIKMASQAYSKPWLQDSGAIEQ